VVAASGQWERGSRLPQFRDAQHGGAIRRFLWRGSTPMSESRHAVFLSYASEDAAAAQRICETLRAAGIEVWFDQSELRGGDAWDTAIRRQIKACALFIPVISANTRARVEGYFRLEWKLAIDRSHLIASERAFLLPVVIDDTKEADGWVPERFREVQWTPLPDGSTPPAFVERVSRLLSLAPPAASATARTPVGAVPARVPATAAQNRWIRWRSSPVLLAIAAALIIAAGYFAVGRLWHSPGPGREAAATDQSGSSTQSAIPEKSIAVLPFLDMSEKRDQAYFSDGLTEELLDLLAQVPDLRVAARTSSFYFKDKSATIAQIGKALGVAQVLEGSVRKAGNTIRVTAQLIRADNGYHLWSKSYDRDIQDTFKVQDEIAAAVVEVLKAKLLPTQQISNSDRNANTDAYDQYLLGKQLLTRGNAENSRRAAVAFRKAIDLDPKYASAWAGLAEAMYWIGDTEDSLTKLEADRKEARAAADNAVTLQPRLAYGYLVRGLMRAAIDLDFAGATADMQHALTLEPGNAEVLMNYGAAVLTPIGHLDEGVALLKKAALIDPLNATIWNFLGMGLLCNGNLSAAHDALHRSLEINAQQTYTPNLLAQTFILDGRPAAALEISQRSTDEVFRLTGAALAQYDLGRRAEAQQQLDALIAKHAFTAAFQVAEIYAWRGDKALALSWLERARVQKDGGYSYLKVDPLLRKLVRDPRYQAMLRAANLQ